MGFVGWLRAAMKGELDEVHCKSAYYSCASEVVPRAAASYMSSTFRDSLLNRRRVGRIWIRSIVKQDLGGPQFQAWHKAEVNTLMHLIKGHERWLKSLVFSKKEVSKVGD